MYIDTEAQSRNHDERRRVRNEPMLLPVSVILRETKDLARESYLRLR